MLSTTQQQKTAEPFPRSEAKCLIYNEQLHLWVMGRGQCKELRKLKATKHMYKSVPSLKRYRQQLWPMLLNWVSLLWFASEWFFEFSCSNNCLQMHPHLGGIGNHPCCYNFKCQTKVQCRPGERCLFSETLLFAWEENSLGVRDMGTAERALFNKCRALNTADDVSTRAKCRWDFRIHANLTSARILKRPNKIPKLIVRKSINIIKIHLGHSFTFDKKWMKTWCVIIAAVTFNKHLCGFSLHNGWLAHALISLTSTTALQMFAQETVTWIKWGLSPFLWCIQFLPGCIVRLASCAHYIKQVMLANFGVWTEKRCNPSNWVSCTLFHDRFLHHVALIKWMEFSKSSEEVYCCFLYFQFKAMLFLVVRWNVSVRNCEQLTLVWNCWYFFIWYAEKRKTILEYK